MTDDAVTEHDARTIRARQTIRIVVLVVLVAAVVAFAVDNSQDVDVGYVFGSATWPLWTVIVGSALVGALIGYVSGRRHG